MRVVRLDEVKKGDLLGRSIFSHRGELMLAAGYALTEDMLGLLRKRRYQQIYLMEHEDDDLIPEDVISETVRMSAEKQVSDAFNAVEKELSAFANQPEALLQNLQNGNNLSQSLPISTVASTVSALLGEILDNNSRLLSALPVKSDSGKLYQHAIDTLTLAVLIGQYFSYDHRELRALGTAAILHDIGKTAFPKINMKKQQNWTFKERWMMREHPTYSMLMLRGSSPHSYQEQTTVLQHHERVDGRGYPQGLTGINQAPIKLKSKNTDSNHIFRHAEILSVAAAFDDLITGEDDGHLHTPQSAVTRLVSEAGMAYNPHVLKALMKVVQFYPTGSHVRVLNTFSGKHVGYQGIVKKANPHEYAKPVLIMTHDEGGRELSRYEIDLQEEEAVYLELLI